VAGDAGREGRPDSRHYAWKADQSRWYARRVAGALASEAKVRALFTSSPRMVKPAGEVVGTVMSVAVVSGNVPLSDVMGLLRSGASQVQSDGPSSEGCSFVQSEPAKNVTCLPEPWSHADHALPG